MFSFFHRLFAGSAGEAPKLRNFSADIFFTERLESAYFGGDLASTKLESKVNEALLSATLPKTKLNSAIVNIEFKGDLA